MCFSGDFEISQYTLKKYRNMIYRPFHPAAILIANTDSYWGRIWTFHSESAINNLYGYKPKSPDFMSFSLLFRQSFTGQTLFKGPTLVFVVLFIYFSGFLQLTI